MGGGDHRGGGGGLPQEIFEQAGLGLLCYNILFQSV